MMKKNRKKKKKKKKNKTRVRKLYKTKSESLINIFS